MGKAGQLLAGSVLAAFMTGGVAQAQTPSDAGAAFDSGFYGGASLSRESLDNVSQVITPLALPLGDGLVGASETDGAAFGLLGGYRRDWGPFTLGAEAWAEVFDLTGGRGDVSTGHAVEPEHRFILRATLGVPVGPALIYGALGAERLTVEYRYRFGSGPTLDFTEDLTGSHAALGLAWPIQGLEARLEYTRSDLEQAAHQSALLQGNQDTEMSGVRLSLVKPLG